MALALPFPSLMLKLLIIVSTMATKTLQIKNLIGRVVKNIRAAHGARAARPLEELRAVLFKTTT